MPNTRRYLAGIGRLTFGVITFCSAWAALLGDGWRDMRTAPRGGAR